MTPVSAELQSDLNSLVARGPKDLLGHLNATLTTGWSFHDNAEPISDTERAWYVNACYTSRSVATLAHIPETDDPDVEWEFLAETANPDLAAKVLDLVGHAVRQALVLEDTRVAHLNRVRAETKAFADTLNSEDPEDIPETLGYRLHSLDIRLADAGGAVPDIVLSDALTVKFTPSSVSGEDEIDVEIFHADATLPVAHASAFGDGKVMTTPQGALAVSDIRKIITRAVVEMETVVAKVVPVPTEVHISAGLDAGLGL